MEKIDFVIAWVDGNDVKHRLKRQQFQPAHIVKGAAEDTRFASNNEIYFAIASILKYVPYLGTIYIITDEQQPAHIHEFVEQGLCASEQIKVIDHKTIFAGHEQDLPTFNSLSIETMLWNIPNLSKYFIYLNDDFFFNAPSELDDFLVENGIKIYGHWQNNALIKAKFKLRKGLHSYLGKPIQPKYTIAQMLSAELCGFKQYYEIHHRPHILDRDVLQNFFQNNPTMLAQQIQHRFRSAFQFLPVGLNNHLKIREEKAILCDDINIAYLKNETLVSRFLSDLNNPTVKFGCIQSLDQFDSKEVEKLSFALIDKFKHYLPLSIQH